jgi:hypothetical protein
MGVSKNDISFFNPPDNVFCDNSGMLEKASRCLGTTSVTPKIASDFNKKKKKECCEFCELKDQEIIILYYVVQVHLHEFKVKKISINRQMIYYKTYS